MESLNALNRYRQGVGLAPSPMNRFRPNIVIGGAGSFGEDSIAAPQVLGSDGRLELVRPCSRCKITDVDQRSGRVESERYFQILKKIRRRKNLIRQAGPMFGVQALSTNAEGQALRVRARLEVLGPAAGLLGVSR